MAVTLFGSDYLSRLIAEMGPLTCEHCGRENMRVNRSHQRTDGLVSFQFRCRNNKCLKNRTVTAGLKTGKLVHSSVSRRRLSHEQVYEILTSTDGVTALARRFGVSRHTVSDVRANRRYQDVHPEIERQEMPPKVVMTGSCKACVHWLNDKCSLRFPEGKNGSYAPLCSCFFEDVGRGIANTLAMAYH